MVRQVQLTIPHGEIASPEIGEEYKGLFRINDVQLEQRVDVPLSPELRRFSPGTSRLDAVIAVMETAFKLNFEVYAGNNHDLLVFRIHQYSLQSLISSLQKTLGIGVHWGRIDTVALSSTIPPLNEQKERSVGFRHLHLGSDEVFQTIDSEASLDFDYILMTIVGSFIATVGLITDSSVTVVASMLVSPLMGPILCIAYGVGLRSKHMVLKGLKVEGAGLLATMLTGAVCGAFAGPFFGREGWRVTVFNVANCTEYTSSGGGCVYNASNDLISWQITSRGTAWGLFSGIWIAIPSGVGVALAITGGGINALVGVAISAALLPPVAQVGFCMAFACFSDTPFDYWMGMAFWAAMLFMLNLLGIIIFAGLTFKFKSITKPLTAKRYWMRQSRHLKSTHKDLVRQLSSSSSNDILENYESNCSDISGSSSSSITSNGYQRPSRKIVHVTTSGSLNNPVSDRHIAQRSKDTDCKVSFSPGSGMPLLPRNSFGEQQV